LNERNINHSHELKKITNIKCAHLYCKVTKISGQKSGLLLEQKFREDLNWKKNKASEANGDLKDKKGLNVEVKISLGSGPNNDKFNYVQLRPHHKIDYYLLTAYKLDKTNVEKNGELYIFKIPKKIVNTLIVKYGTYAYGTKKKLGEITLNKLKEKEYEYTLRPKLNSDLFKEFLKYRVKVTDL